MSYSDCFWTATGDMDCSQGQFQEPIYNHAPHHIMQGQELYRTVPTQVINQNLGYNLRGGGDGYGVGYGNNYGNSYSAGANLGNSTVSDANVLAYKLPEMMRELGQPDAYDPSVGGIAVWHSPRLKSYLGGVFQRVEVHDDRVANLSPIVFNGHVYTWTKCELTPSFVRSLTDIMPFVWYDRQKRQLVVRTDTLDHNLSILAVTSALKGKIITFSQLRNYDLVKKYLLSICPYSRFYNRYCRATYINLIRNNLYK